MSDSRGWKNIIYKTQEEIPHNAGTYNNTKWAQKQLNRIKNYKEELDLLKNRNSLLINYVNSLDKKDVTIVDFGGGLGLSYIALMESLDLKLNYYVIEVPKICEAGNGYFKNNDSIKFNTEIPKNITNVDIVYIRTSLQYTKDWKECLSTLSNLNPKYFILSHVSAGDVPTYLTLQLWADQEIPYWFLNKDELKDIMLENDYNVIYDKDCFNIKDDVGWKTYQYFPDEYKLKTFIDLIFSK